MRSVVAAGVVERVSAVRGLSHVVSQEEVWVHAVLEMAMGRVMCFGLLTVCCFIPP